MNINKALFTFIKIAFSVMVVLLIVYGGVHLCRVGYDYGYRLFTEPAVDEAPGTDMMVQVKADMSASDIAEMLEEKGLVRDSSLFCIQMKLSSFDKKIKPGVYTLNTSMKPKELMAAMVPREETESTEDTQDTDNTEDAGDEAEDTKEPKEEGE